MRLFLTFQHLDQVEPKLALHGTMDRANRFVEHNLVEDRTHLTRAKSTQVAALAGGRALRVLSGQSGEISAAVELPLQLLAKPFIGDENMSSASVQHVASQRGSRGRYQ